MPRRTIKLFGVAGLAFGMLLVPASVLADHPGIIGPVTHLGGDTVLRVMLAALLDGVNPTALGIMLFICYRTKQQKLKPVKPVLLFLSGLLLVYIIAGIILRLTYSSFGPILPIQVFQILIATLLFLSGLREVEQAFKPSGKKLVQLPKVINSSLARFDKLLKNNLVLLLGMFVGVVELFATGAIYLSFMQAITYDKTAPWWVTVVTMAIYVVTFMLPLLLAFSYRDTLLADASDKNLRRARRTRAVAGVIFMLAALFIAASAIVTIQAIGAG